jgi:hypothetical protein
MTSLPMPTTIRGMQDWLADLAPQIAPDLTDVPVYIVNARLRGFHGCTSTTTDVTYMDRIAEWRGRGVAMAIDFREIQKYTQATRLYQPRFLDHWRLLAADVFMHELAHILERPQPCKLGPVAEPPRVIRAKQVNLLEHVAAMSIEPTNSPAFIAQHPLAFLRMALHIVHRAKPFIPYATIGGVFCGSGYGLSSGYAYREALGGEPERMTDATFAEIRGTKPPAAFVDLWRRDVAAWLARIPNPTSFQQFVAEDALRAC